MLHMLSSQSYSVTDGRSISKSWCRTPSGAHDQIFISFTVTVLFLWGALSDERTGLSFVYAAGPRQRSLSRVRVPWNSRPYFTVSVLRLPFSSPPTTRRVTVEVFDPASTRVWTRIEISLAWCSLGADHIENTASNCASIVMRGRLPSNVSSTCWVVVA
jgi:hypothetical protein